MKNKIFFSIFFLYACSCNSPTDTKRKEPNSVIIQDGSSNTIQANISDVKQDSFYLSNILFSHKKKLDFGSQLFRSECEDIKIKSQSSKNKHNTIFKESNFLYDFFDIYNMNKSEPAIVTNVDFVESFVKKLGWSDENLKMYNLKIETNMEIQISSYGVCKFLVLKKNEIANAEQSKFLVLLNYKRREISLWDFDNFSLKGKDLYIDFRMNDMHSIYQVNFCKKLGKFYFIKMK